MYCRYAKMVSAAFSSRIQICRMCTDVALLISVPAWVFSCSFEVED
jgi:hypothetical protein